MYALFRRKPLPISTLVLLRYCACPAPYAYAFHLLGVYMIHALQCFTRTQNSQYLTVIINFSLSAQAQSKQRDCSGEPRPPRHPAVPLANSDALRTAQGDLRVQSLYLLVLTRCLRIVRCLGTPVHPNSGAPLASTHLRLWCSIARSDRTCPALGLRPASCTLRSANLN